MNIKNALLTLTLLLLSLLTEAQLPWRLVDVTTKYSDNSIASTNNGYVYIWRQDELYRSTQNGDSGSFIKLTNAPQVGMPTEVYAYGENVFLLNKTSSPFGGIWRSADYGASWTQSNKGFAVADIRYLNGIAFIDSGCIIIVVNDGQNPNKLYVSNDQGITWTNRLTIQGGPSPYVDIVRRNNKLYLFRNNKKYESTNNGVSWSKPNGYSGPTSLLHSMVVLSDGTFIIKSGFQIISSTDSGNTWKQVSTVGIGSSSLSGANFIKSYNSDTLYYISSSGSASPLEVRVSGDKGVTWQKFETGLPAILDAAPWRYYAQRLHISNNGYMFLEPDMYAGPVDYSGLYRTSTRVTKPFKVPLPIKPDTPSSVNNAKPAAFAANVYPNPATGVVNITFTQEQFGAADITISNLQGKTMIVVSLQPGEGYRSHQIDINALPAGIYVISITTPGGYAIQNHVKS